MKRIVVKIILWACITGNCLAQKGYDFSINLKEVQNDKVTVELIVPSLKLTEAVYHLPKVVPGTYAIHNYGSFISNFQVFDKKGNTLKVEHPDKNTWKIADVKKLYKISYQVDDTWDTPSIQEDIFEPAGTNIQQDTVFILNNFGFFGYFKGYEKKPYKVAITKPSGFYGSTSLVLNKKNTTSSKDIFEVKDYYTLVDAPIMYCRPDTTFLKIGNTDVLISVFSSNKKTSSKILAKDIKPVLEAQKQYLGGNLTVNKYAFIVYMTSKEGQRRYGALEHGQSSFYFFLEKFSAEELSEAIKNGASHEFLHIVTPLNIHSEEIGNFDFINPKMSKHLWFYEGLTEYATHHSKLKGGLINLEEYLKIQREKIIASQKFNDQLPFTELSAGVLDQFKDQYLNVYQKGALIGLCLDIQLRELSKGKYGTQELMRDLAKTYGKNKSFKDDELFDVITKLTYPEIRDFFTKYVEGKEPLPIADIFQKIGVQYHLKGFRKEVFLFKSLGFENDRFTFMARNPTTLEKYPVPPTKLGQALGFQANDELISVNNVKIGFENIDSLSKNIKKAKIGDDLSVMVLRKQSDGSQKEIILKTKIFEEEREYQHLFDIYYDKPEQMQLREAWMGRKE